jgi:hypothetical protein
VSGKRKRNPIVRITEAEAAKWPQEKPPLPSEEFGDRHFLKPIEAGDWHALAGYLARGFPLTAMRKFVVEVLYREVKRPKPNRPREAATLTRQLPIAAYVFDLKRKGHFDYIKQAAELFGTYPKDVERAVAAFPNINAEQVADVFAAKGWPFYTVANGPPVTVYYKVVTPVTKKRRGKSDIKSD